MLTTCCVQVLSQIHEGEKVVISALREGNELNRRLASMGFTPGVDVEIMQNFGHGPMIVKVRGTKVAIGRGEAEKIKVDRRINE